MSHSVIFARYTDIKCKQLERAVYTAHCVQCSFDIAGYIYRDTRLDSTRLDSTETAILGHILFHKIQIILLSKHIIMIIIICRHLPLSFVVIYRDTGLSVDTAGIDVLVYT